MANTVTILSYTNTFGDLLAQQNKAAVEINNISANNYTKETGTLYLAGSGTGLSVSNTTVMNVAIISGTTSLLGDITSTANAYFNGIGYGLNVANNAIIAKTLITDNFTANTLTRTGTVIASGTAYVNAVTANTIVRSQTLNATGATYTDAVVANTIIFAPIFNGSTSGTFNNITSNNAIYTQDITATGTISGFATLTGSSTTTTTNTNANNTVIATTGFVKNVLNSGNTFSIGVVDGVVTSGSYSDPAWITALAGSKIIGNITGTSANITNFIINQNLSTSSSVQFNSLGVGTAVGATGEIRATNNITAYYSDDRLKTRLGNIENALAKVMSLNGFQYEANETAQALGYTVRPEIGLSAQEVQAVLPEVVVPAPIDEQYLTIHYERVIPLLVEAIKELKKEFDSIRKPLDNEL
jgi:hypothetical protein